MATSSDFKVGDKVYFGRRQGEQTLGTVIKVNPTTLKVRQEESRGTMKSHPIGTPWTVPFMLASKVGETAVSPAPVVADALTLKVGQTVEYTGFSWTAKGDTTLQGVVTKLGQGAYEVYGNGRTQVLQHDKVKPVAKRDFATVKDVIGGVYGSLSPENLTCDGELPRAQVESRRAQLHRALKALFIEAGREVTESEAFGLPAYKGEETPFSKFTRLGAKAAGFKVGDKVSFEVKGQTIVGFVKRVNAGTISVLPVGETDSRRYWRVSPSLVKAA